MKTKILSIVLFLSGILVNVSCGKNGETSIEEGEIANATLTLTVNVANSNEVTPTGRGIESGGSPTQLEESKIFNCSAYVFYDNGSLEKTVALTSGTETISGLTAGDKRVVVLANVPSGYASITHYDDIATEMMDLDTQEPSQLATCGLAMSGESACTLIKNSSNALTVQVSRVVAKIAVGGITIGTAAGHDPSLFTLVAVHIMKAKAEANMGIPTMGTGSNFYGGVAATVSATAKTYLTESIAVGQADRFFYVFPNDNTSDNATMLTIEGTYDGVRTFFSFYINDKETGLAGNGTGEYIKRNTQHTITVTLKKLDGGSSDPEQAADPADLDITITADDWVVIPAQSVEW